MTKTILNSDFLISKSEICLVNMPFYSLEFPSIGLGTLKSILQCAHINTSVIHANMLFAEKIGIEKWHTILSYTSTTNVQEWLFSDYLHNSPHNIKKNNEEYFKLILPDLKFKIENGLLEPNNKIRNIDIKKELLLIKKSATKFIDDLAQIILTKEPKVVGCSSVFAQNLASLALLRKVKELAPKVFTILGDKLINAHGSYLPEYRGAAQYIFYLANKDSQYGVTIHYMEPGLDTGDIIFQRRFNIPERWSVYDLHYAMSASFGDLLNEFLEGNNSKRTQQDHSKATETRMPTKEDMLSVRMNGKKLMRVKDFFTHI